MELCEQVASLKKEIQVYKEHFESINAEKIALDQMLVECLKNSLTYKKELILKDEVVKKLNMEMDILKAQLSSIKEKEALIEEIAA